MPLAAQNHHSAENEEVPIISAITEEEYRESKKETEEIGNFRECVA